MEALLPDIQQRGIDSKPAGGIGQLTKKSRTQSRVKTANSARAKGAERYVT